MDKNVLELRTLLDNIDNNILQLLEERMDIVRQVGDIKLEFNIPIEDIRREEKIIKKLKNISKNNLTKSQLKKIFQTIFNFSKIEQNH
jgi:chorismate mutase/prephenate dehydratase|tara:strand:+ start:1583 stop:1846 length:264 start_codon:yes stop_codon:yes gene_type:complete